MARSEQNYNCEYFKGRRFIKAILLWETFGLCS